MFVFSFRTLQINSLYVQTSWLDSSRIQRIQSTKLYFVSVDKKILVYNKKA